MSGLLGFRGNVSLKRGFLVRQVGIPTSSLVSRKITSFFLLDGDRTRVEDTGLGIDGGLTTGIDARGAFGVNRKTIGFVALGTDPLDVGPEDEAEENVEAANGEEEKGGDKGKGRDVV